MSSPMKIIRPRLSVGESTGIPVLPIMRRLWRPLAVPPP